GERVSEAVYRSWDVAIEAIGTSWMLLDQSTQEKANAALSEVLFAAGAAPAVADRLLKSFMPRTGRLTDPIEIWRGAYGSAMLARIASHDRMTPVVRERAQSQLQVAL